MTTKIFVAGHNGMVGSAIVKELSKDNDNLIYVASKKELDLRHQDSVKEYFLNKLFDQVYLAAARVGGIKANNEYPAEFIFDNLSIQANIIDSCHISGVKKMLFLGSSCIYPKFSKQPIKEEYLLDGHLEATNEPYAIAKIAGIKLCESYNRQYGCDFRSIMPTNLYGPNDNFHPENSHVIPALIRRFHEAKNNNDNEVTVWGTGLPRREFLHVDDLASASIHIMGIEKKLYNQITNEMQSHLNVGTGIDISIKELAEIIKEITGYEGKIAWDDAMPDGTPKKLLDISKIKATGWTPKKDFTEGLAETYHWFNENREILR